MTYDTPRSVRPVDLWKFSIHNKRRLWFDSVPLETAPISISPLTCHFVCIALLETFCPPMELRNLSSVQFVSEWIHMLGGDEAAQIS